MSETSGGTATCAECGQSSGLHYYWCPAVGIASEARLREIIREEVTDALQAFGLIADPKEGPSAPLISMTPEIEAWYEVHRLTDDQRRIVPPEVWARTQVAALAHPRREEDAWLPPEHLNWQGRAYVELYNDGAFARDSIPRTWLAFWYYMSLAQTHPDWNVEGSPAWVVRQARERAIAEQRERQGGNPR